MHERVGNNIQKLRMARGMTQAQLAQQAGVARVSILSIERGRFLPTIETALRISRVLECPVEAIFWIRESKK